MTTRTGPLVMPKTRGSLGEGAAAGTSGIAGVAAADVAVISAGEAGLAVLADATGGGDAGLGLAGDDAAAGALAS
jgi:hypothetical protein